MNWFTPKCPIGSEDKLWVEEAFQWLIDELGPDVLADVEVILPIEEYFPDPYSGKRIAQLGCYALAYAPGYCLSSTMPSASFLR